jgi:hypothetical protein
MKILYHIPSLYSIYAQRTIYHGFRNAFIGLGHQFKPLTADDDPIKSFESYRPDIFMTASFFWYRKYLDYNILKNYRKQGMFTLVKIDFWQSPLSKSRVNEAPSLKNDKEALRLIQNDLLGDAFYHVVEPGDPRMEGFEKYTGHSYHTIPLAADASLLREIYDPDFVSDISYIGTNLPGKRKFFRECVFPLRKKYAIRLYGQDWTLIDRWLGWVQRIGQYFNLPFLRSIRKPKLKLEDEAKIYSSSKISINVHESYQRQYGGDCNERTFKIPICGGFQIVDNVACIKKYFNGGEIVIAENRNDWFDKIEYYMKYPEKRNPIIDAGKKRVLSDHTYFKRAEQIISIYRQMR